MNFDKNFIKNSYIKFSKFFFFIIITYIFWVYKNLDLAVETYSLYERSDLSRYKNWFEEYKINNIIHFRLTDDFSYYWLTYLLSLIGINFKFFLFSSIFLYFIILSSLFSKITNCKSWIIFFIFFVLTSYWAIPLMTVAFRQGLAFLILISLYFYKEDNSFFIKLISILIASSFHFSAIIFLPLLFFEKFLIKRIYIIDALFLIISLLYISNITIILKDIFFNSLLIFNIELRAFNNDSPHYQLGFTPLKAIAIFFPYILFRLLVIRNNYFGNYSIRVFLFFCYGCSIGMLLSGLPYHDRIMLYVWPLSSIFISISLLIMIKWYNSNVILYEQNK